MKLRNTLFDSADLLSTQLLRDVIRDHSTLDMSKCNQKVEKNIDQGESIKARKSAKTIIFTPTFFAILTLLFLLLWIRYVM